MLKNILGKEIYLKINKIITNIVFPGKIYNNSYFNKILNYPNNKTKVNKYISYFISKNKNKLFQLNQIKDNILRHKEKLDKNDYNFLLSQINLKIEKIRFLNKVIKIEYNKFFKIKLKNNILSYDKKKNKFKLKKTINYDYYNQLFFNVSKTKNYNVKDIKNIIKSHNDNKNNNKLKNNIFFSKLELMDILKYMKSIFPEFNYKFGNYSTFSHQIGTIYIPDLDKYSLRSIITIFFHETTHLIRYLNTKRNFGFNFQTETYINLDEGLAIYNEYLYGNKILEGYGDFLPYYDICFTILSKKNLTKEEKENYIYEILKLKGVEKDKIRFFINRFYRYSLENNTANFFLKDLVYNSGYDFVTNLFNGINSDYTINNLMLGKFGIKDIDFFLLKIDKNKNINHELIFDKIMKKIQNILTKKK